MIMLYLQMVEALIWEMHCWFPGLILQLRDLYEKAIRMKQLKMQLLS